MYSKLLTMAKKLCIVGAGKMGTAITRVVGPNVLMHPEFSPEVVLWSHEEQVDGRNLSDVIQETRENPKYLPGAKIPDNVVVTSDLKWATENSDIFAFVLPHQFIEDVCREMKPMLKPNSMAVSLVKSRAVFVPRGVDDVSDNETEPLHLVSKIIHNALGINVHVLLGANLARDIVAEKFCEATIGAADPEEGALLKKLFLTENFRIRIATDVNTVELCSALKNVVACGAGIVDGLGCGDNTKAAVIRLGLMEIMRFVESFYPGSHLPTFFESSGIGNLITTCYAGSHRTVSSHFAQNNGKTKLRDLEVQYLDGNCLQGPHTAEQVFLMLKEKNLQDNFPLFTALHRIFQHELTPSQLIDCLRAHPEHTDYYKMTSKKPSQPVDGLSRCKMKYPFPCLVVDTIHAHFCCLHGRLLERGINRRVKSMTSRRTCQGAHPGTPSEIDELLDKVRKLQKMLPSPSAPSPYRNRMEPNLPLSASQTRTPSRSRARNRSASDSDREEIQTANVSTPVRAPCSRKSPPQSRNSRKDSQIDTTSLIAEADDSIELLRQVTFVRVVIDEIHWENPPDLLRRDFGGRNKSPREKGQLMVEYGFPESTSESRTLKKKVRAHAKSVNLSVAHFNHRRVALLKVTAPLVQLWTRSSLWFRILYKIPERNGKNTTRLFGRCQIPLDDLLILPFSVSESLPIECLNEFYGSKGTLQVCVQLGSRSASFSERVDSMRTKSKKGGKKGSRRVDYQSMDPQILNKRLGVREEEERPRPLPMNFSTNGVSATSTPQTSERHGVKDWDQRPLPPSPFEFSPKKFDAVQSEKSKEKEKELNGSLREIENRRQSLRRSSTGVMLSSTEPQRSPNSPFAIDQGVQSTSWRSTACQTEELSENGQASVQTSQRVESRPRRLEVRTGGERSSSGRLSKSAGIPRSTLLLQPRFPDRLAQSSAAAVPSPHKNQGTSTDRHNETFTLNREDESGERAGRTRMMYAESTDDDEGLGGYLLEITVHSAMKLPHVKGTSKNPSAQKPNVFVSYRGEENIRSSPVIEKSTDPIWDWRTFFYVCKGRKNIVLKVWHRCPERGDRVLGFVSCDLPGTEPSKRSTGEYDLVDLSQSSTGRLTLTLGPGKEPPLTKTHLTGYTDRNSSHLSQEKMDQGKKSKSSPDIAGGFGSGSSRTEPVDHHETEISLRSPMRTADRPTSTHSQGTGRSSVMNRSMNTSLAYLEKLQHDCQISPNPFEMASVSFLESKLKSNMVELESMLNNLERGKQSEAGAGTFRLRVGSTSEGSSSADSRPQSQEPCDIALQL